MSNSTIWLIDRTLSGATTPGQSGPRSNVKKGVLHIPESSKTETLPSDWLISYKDTCWGGGAYPTAEMQSVYSTGAYLCILVNTSCTYIIYTYLPNSSARAGYDTRSIFK